MSKIIKLILLIIAVVSIPAMAISESDNQPNYPPKLLIVELQTASIDSASQEFIEIYNLTDKVIDGSLYKIQYLSAGGTSWLTRVKLVGELQPRGRFLISSAEYIADADMISGLGLAADGGHIRIIKSTNEEDILVDQIAWGTAVGAIVLSAPAPTKDQSLKRLVNEDGHFIDTDDDSVDFIISLSPSPERAVPLTINDEQ